MEKSSVIGTFTGKCCDGNVFNNNDMKLSVELFENLFASEDYKTAMQNRYYIGFLGHPDDPNCMDFKDACIVMTECHIDDNGEVIGSFDLIDTPVGQVVKAFIDAGVTFGISIRGAGDVDGEGNVDPETFVFRGFDLVTFPAYDDCVPEFQAIAASSELDKQVKYKKVCATVKRNLTSITSSEALDIIQSQFREGTDEYNAVDERLNELNPVEEESCVEAEQLDGMTQLFLDTNEALAQAEERIAELEAQLTQCQMDRYNVELACSRKIASFKRISASQIRDIESELDGVNAKYKSQVIASRRLKDQIADLQAAKSEADARCKRSISANTRLKAELDAEKDANLKYVHKIEATSKTIAQKESTISRLESDLHETVVAESKLKKETSNLDENVRTLQSRVEAAEQMVLSYQQAYANMYANALGVHISNLSITASTSVGELQKMIGERTASYQTEYDESEISDLEFDPVEFNDGTATL